MKVECVYPIPPKRRIQRHQLICAARWPFLAAAIACPVVNLCLGGSAWSLVALWGLWMLWGDLVAPTMVEKNSPAEKAGLQVKDIVVEVDGTIVSSSQEMVNAMASKKAGDTVEIKYFRMEGDESKWESYDDIQGDYHTVTVELAMLDETHS